MCGIVGLINFTNRKVDQELFLKSVRTLKHRGPDMEGIYIDGSVAIGHKRLSILDLSKAGRQPMIDQTGRYIISYNGEIYNFKEIRSELKNLGYQFSSNTDTEVILVAWRQWGTQSLNRFNGMFAFSLLDKKLNKFFIARDRYGVKPLYYLTNSKYFIFASEQRAILANIDYKLDLDEFSLREYFSFQNVISDRTFYKNIKQLSPGSIVTIDLENKDINIKKFWDYNFLSERSKKSGDYDVYKEELDRLLIRSIKNQLISDVEVGSYLSGGIDSGTITSIASKEIQNLKTFNCSFNAGINEQIYDESESAKIIADFNNTYHFQVNINNNEMLDSIKKIRDTIEEPRMGQSYPNYIVAEYASRHVKVILSGTGGDELFGGYPWRYYQPLAGEENHISFKNYFNSCHKLFSADKINELFLKSNEKIENEYTETIFSDIFFSQNIENNSKENFLNNCFYFEAKTFLNGLFIIEDKLSMANSLETRVPFMDNDLVDFAMKCPLDFKLSMVDNHKYNIGVQSNNKKNNDGKRILRSVTKDYLPPNISNASKQGFTPPPSWHYSEKNLRYLHKNFIDGNSNIYNWLNKKMVVSILEDHIKRKKNYGNFIWSLLNFDLWVEDNY
jgi:asparagine synthase (glutamine-hydrolysing)